MDAEGGRLDQANLALLAAFEPILAQMFQGFVIIERQTQGGRRAILVQVFVVLVGNDAVQEDVEEFVTLGFGVLLA